jgi:hypothetical protein
MSNRKPKLSNIKTQKNKKAHYTNDAKLKHRKVGNKSTGSSNYNQLALLQTKDDIIPLSFSRAPTWTSNLI